VTSPTHTNETKIQKIGQTQSIGAEFATVLIGEVFFRPFTTRQHGVSHLALTPSLFQSGSVSCDQGISSLSASFRGSVGTRKGRIPRITVVAMAPH
jgi:hypothetical protein